MAIFDFFKSKKNKDYSYSKYNQDDYWEKPVFDYSPENYNKHYPRQYEMTSYVMLEDGIVFSRDVKDYLLRDLVKRVIFTDAPFPEDYKLVDLSLDQDRSILGWNQTIGDEMCLVISTGEKGKGIYLNRACNMMFVGFTALRSIEWNNVISTKEVRSMQEMFAGLTLKSLDLSCFDVSNVKYMNGLFSTCKKLKEIKWFRFNTSKVEDVSYMFTNCHALDYVDLSGFDTSSLTDCKKMFNRCGVKAINLGNWYPTSPEKELNIEDMFHTTGVLSLLTTNNPSVQKLFLNPPDDETRDCLKENDIPRKVVPVSEWKVPVYSWEKEERKRWKDEHQVEM